MASKAQNSVDNSCILKPGQIIRPILTDEAAKELVQNVYGLKVQRIKEFNSYDDKTFYVQVEASHKNAYIQELCPYGYILKVLNGMDSQKPYLIEGNNELMLYIHNQGINVNIPIQNLKGGYQSLEKITSLDGQNCSYNIIRLLTFIPGDILYNIECTPELCYDIGKLAATIDKALKGFHHPAYDTHQSIWMLSNAPQIKQFFYAIQDNEKKALVQSILQDFENDVLSNIDKFTKGMIHGDINEQNLIVRKSDGNIAKYEISGIIDVGDSQYNCYLFEVTLAATYMMIMGNDDNFIQLGSKVIAGYVSLCDLSDVEWNLLKICIETRYCQSLVMGAYTHIQDPTNVYALTTAKKGWSQLKKFRNISTANVRKIWNSALTV